MESDNKKSNFNIIKDLIFKNPRSFLKILWFFFIFISVLILYFNNFGEVEIIRFDRLSTNDVLFFMILILSLLPFFIDLRIKTPWGELNPEQEKIINERGNQYQQLQSDLSNQVETTFNLNFDMNHEKVQSTEKDGEL